jgi:hypothetical protein
MEEIRKNDIKMMKQKNKNLTKLKKREKYQKSRGQDVILVNF